MHMLYIHGHDRAGGERMQDLLLERGWRGLSDMEGSGVARVGEWEVLSGGVRK